MRYYYVTVRYQWKTRNKLALFKTGLVIRLRMKLFALIMIEINLLYYRRHRHLLETISSAETSRENRWTGGMRRKAW